MTNSAEDRLRYLVAVAMCDTYETTTGIVKPKTQKRREQEWAIANEVVRFAFDHAGVTRGYLAPGGLLMSLMDEVDGGNRATNTST